MAQNSSVSDNSLGGGGAFTKFLKVDEEIKSLKSKLAVMKLSEEETSSHVTNSTIERDSHVTNSTIERDSHVTNTTTKQGDSHVTDITKQDESHVTDSTKQGDSHVTDDENANITVDTTTCVTSHVIKPIPHVTTSTVSKTTFAETLEFSDTSSQDSYESCDYHTPPLEPTTSKNQCNSFLLSQPVIPVPKPEPIHSSRLSQPDSLLGLPPLYPRITQNCGLGTPPRRSQNSGLPIPPLYPGKTQNGAPLLYPGRIQNGPPPLYPGRIQNGPPPLYPGRIQNGAPPLYPGRIQNGAPPLYPGRIQNGGLHRPEPIQNNRIGNNFCTPHYSSIPSHHVPNSMGIPTNQFSLKSRPLLPNPNAKPFYPSITRTCNPMGIGRGNTIPYPPVYTPQVPVGLGRGEPHGWHYHHRGGHPVNIHSGSGAGLDFI